MTPANEAALMSILAEWQSADSDSTRFTDINTGTGRGLNSTNQLNYGTTVLDNGKVNTLTAQAGAAVPWVVREPARRRRCPRPATRRHRFAGGRVLAVDGTVHGGRHPGLYRRELISPAQWPRRYPSRMPQSCFDPLAAAWKQAA
jgi:hypothetical protein